MNNFDMFLVVISYTANNSALVRSCVCVCVCVCM